MDFQKAIRHKSYVDFFDSIKTFTDDIYIAITIDEARQAFFFSDKETIYFTDGQIRPSQAEKDLEIVDFTYIIARRTFSGADGFTKTHHSLTVNYDADIPALQHKIQELSALAHFAS